MEGMKIYDFDCIESEFRIVKIKQREFKIPGDYPASLLMASQKYSELLNANDTGAFEHILKHLYHYFKILNEDIVYDDFISLITIDKIPMLLSAIMYDISPKETKEKIEEATKDIKKK